MLGKGSTELHTMVVCRPDPSSADKVAADLGLELL